jgi:hypothetical protein
MKYRLAVLLGAALLASGPMIAAEKKADAAHVRKDIADHRAMAEAHLNATKCLEGGTPEKDCQAQLEKDCKGLGIGKYCGMKHRH